MQKTASEGWVFKCSQRKLLGPRNNMQKATLVAVTRTGVVRVMSQVQDFKTEIENISSPLEMLTHAAMCPEKIADRSTNEQGQHILIRVTGKD